jgi:hypothetical protein
MVWSGDLVEAAVGDVGDLNPRLGRRIDVDVVVTDAVARDHLAARRAAASITGRVTGAKLMSIPTALAASATSVS